MTTLGSRLDVVAKLRRSVYEEGVAEAAYLRRAQSADPVTARLYRHIAKEEHKHASEFDKRMKILAKVRGK